VPLPETSCRWCDTFDELLIEVSSPARSGLQLYRRYSRSP
jgi:hypothetical protein